MDLRQLGYLVAVAEELNFARAAARCHIVQSGLSTQIANLERELGIVLFERSRRVTRLSAAGEAFLPHAKAALAQIEAGRVELAVIAGEVRGTLRLGVIPVNHGFVDVPEVLATYHRRFPDVNVVVSDVGSLAMVSMVGSGDLDAAFVGLFPAQLPETLSHQLIGVEPLVVVLDRDNSCTRRAKVDLAELAPTTSFIECHHDSGLRTQVDLAFVRAGVSRTVDFELGNLLDVARMASLGLGAAVVPKSVAMLLPSGPVDRFVVLPLTDPQAQQPVTLLSGAPDSGSRPAQMFVRLFTDAAAGLRQQP